MSDAEQPKTRVKVIIRHDYISTYMLDKDEQHASEFERRIEIDSDTEERWARIESEFSQMQEEMQALLDKPIESGQIPILSRNPNSGIDT